MLLCYRDLQQVLTEIAPEKLQTQNPYNYLGFSCFEKNTLYIGHIRAHSGLPGPLAAGNDCTDRDLIGEAFVSDPIILPKCGHNKIHLSSHTLRLLHKITKEQARMIVKRCPDCLTLSQVPCLGVNP